MSQKQIQPDSVQIKMEFTLMITIFTLSSCLLLPLVIAGYFVLRKILTQRRLANMKTMTSLAPTLSTVVSIDVPGVAQAESSTSSFSPYSPQITETPLSILTFSPRRTPFGTHRKPLDLASSLKASMSKGPEALAAALDGVLALHHRLEAIRQHRNDTSPHQDRNSLICNSTDLGQIAYM